MNFFEHQREARQKTAVMGFVFTLCYILTAAALSFIVMKSLSYLGRWPKWEPFWWSFGGFLFYSFLVVLGKWIEIKENPIGFLSQSTRAVRVDQSDDFYQNRLNNIVDEMSIASGVPRPALRIIPNDPSINAFAVGLSIHNSGIFVTDGAARGLNRQEIQAVIAHEFSHILNGDMQSNTVMIALIEGLEGFSNAAFDLSKPTHSGRGGLNILQLIPFILGIVGYIGWFVASIVKALFSQQKEYLADASSVQFTRDGSAMTSVLEKIMLLEEKGMARSAKTPPQVAHMTFSESITSVLSFSSHPPTIKRIRRINPSYNPTRSLFHARKKANFELFYPFDGFKEDSAMGFVSDSQTALNEQKENIDPSFGSSHYFGDFTFLLMGMPGQKTVEQKLNDIVLEQKELDFSIPEIPLFALVLSKTPEFQKKQIALIERYYGGDFSRKTAIVFEKIQNIPKLTQVAILINNLDKIREFQKNDFLKFNECSKEIFKETDSSMEIDQAYAMILKCYLNELNIPYQKTFGTWSIQEAHDDIERALWFICQTTSNPAKSFESAWSKIDPRPRSRPMAKKTWGAFEESSFRLNNLSPEAKKQLIEAATVAISCDKKYFHQEILSLQCLCFAIHSPTPPLFVAAS